MWRCSKYVAPDEAHSIYSIDVNIAVVMVTDNNNNKQKGRV